MIVVQHMPAMFTKLLAERLDPISQVKVSEARDGDRIVPGTVYIAPGDFNIRVVYGDEITLNQDAPRHGVRPCADILMESVAEVYGLRAVGIVLTGMGNDGTAGAKAIKDLGGHVVAEHESTCVVYGMPKSVVSAGLADEVVSLPLIADSIIELSK